MHVADVVRELRLLFPWKTSAAMGQLYRALLLDQKGAPLVDYSALLLGDEQSHKTGKRSHLGEALRFQYMDDLLAFRQVIVAAVHRQLALGTAVDHPVDHQTTTDGGGGLPATSVDAASTLSIVDGPGGPGGGPGLSNNTVDAGGRDVARHMLSLQTLRTCLQQCDPSKPVQDINRLLALATGLPLAKVIHEDATVVHAPSFLAKLPTILIKPTGNVGFESRTNNNNGGGGEASPPH